MKPKLYESNDTKIGKNELVNKQKNQNYLQLNYQFKFRYLNENVQTEDKSIIMDLPIDLSIKRTSPVSLDKLNEQKELNKQNNVNRQNDKSDHHLKTQFNSKNEVKLLPYLLMSNQATNLTTKSLATNSQAKLNENNLNNELSTNHSDADLLKYNKKKLFLASVRKQTSSIDNSSNLSSNGNTFSSSSSSSNSPNSTPSHTINQSPNSDRRNSSSSTTSSTNLTLSPNSDHDDLIANDNQQSIVNKEFNSNRIYHLPDSSFGKKIEYFSKYYKLTELKDNSNGILNNKSNCELVIDKQHTDKANLNNGKLNENSKFPNNYLRSIERSIKCNSRLNIGLKRSLSESYLLDKKQEDINNLLTYKRKQLRKCRSESDLIELNRCNDRQLIIKQNGNLNPKRTELNNNQITQQPQQQLNRQHQFTNDSNSIDSELRNQQKQTELYELELKRQFYLRNQTIKEDELMNYTKQLMRNQKSIYQFSQFNNHHFNEFDLKFSQLKSNSLPLNLQLNRNKASHLTFNNSQIFNKKTLNGPLGPNKLNEKTGKRKFTKLASDEDEEDLEDEDENEENIIVDHLSNTASTSVSPSSIQSNSDSSLINKQLLSKHHLTIHNQLTSHHLDPHSENNNLVDLRLPFINHHSTHLNNLTRRTIQGKQNFGNLPDLLTTNDLIQNESTITHPHLNNNSNNLKDDLNSWKFYKDYYYLLLNQPDSPAKLNALQWIMKDLNEKNNHLADDWADSELKLNSPFKQYSSLDSNGPINLAMFQNLNRNTNSSNLIDPAHRQINTSRLDKFTANSPINQPINLTNIQLTPDNYLQYVKMNENLLNRHNSQQQLQILTNQNGYLNLDNSSNHCLPPGTPNSFQDRKRISRPLTGRHVRQGTGASPATLANLRSMIKERQKFRELNGLSVNNGKKFRKKRK